MWLHSLRNFFRHWKLRLPKVHSWKKETLKMICLLLENYDVLKHGNFYTWRAFIVVHCVKISAVCDILKSCNEFLNRSWHGFDHWLGAIFVKLDTKLLKTWLQFYFFLFYFFYYTQHIQVKMLLTQKMLVFEKYTNFWLMNWCVEKCPDF